MRIVMALLFAGMLVAGCAGEPYDDPSSSETAEEMPEDTLPALGAWVSDPDAGLEHEWILTLSDSNAYTLTDTCNEAPGRWELSRGQVVLTPDDDGAVHCERWSDEVPEMAPAYDLTEFELVPDGEGFRFVRP